MRAIALLVICLAFLPINSGAKEWVGWNFGLEGIHLLGVGYPSGYSETIWTDPITGREWIDIHISCDPCDQVCAIHDADGTLRTNGSVGAGCDGSTRSSRMTSEDVYISGSRKK